MIGVMVDIRLAYLRLAIRPLRWRWQCELDGREMLRLWVGPVELWVAWK